MLSIVAFGALDSIPYIYADLHQPIQPIPTVFGPNPANMIIVGEFEASALFQQLQHLQDRVREDHVDFNLLGPLQQAQALIENSRVQPHFILLLSCLLCQGVI